jgi:hypothetical protein
MGKLFIPGNKVVAAFTTINSHGTLGASPRWNGGMLDYWYNRV